MTSQSQERLREIIQVQIFGHHFTCDCLNCRRKGRIDQAIENLINAGFIHKDEVKVDEEKVLKVIMGFWRNPPRRLCEYREFPDGGFMVKFTKEALAHTLSQSDIIKEE